MTTFEEFHSIHSWRDFKRAAKMKFGSLCLSWINSYGITFKDIQPLLNANSESVEINEEAAKTLLATHPEDAELIGEVVHSLQTLEDGAVLNQSEIDQVQQMQNGAAFLQSFNTQQFQPQRYRFFAPKQTYGLVESYHAEANANPKNNALAHRQDFKEGLEIAACLPVYRLSAEYELTNLALWPSDLPFSELETLYGSIKQLGLNLNTFRLGDLVAIGRYEDYRNMITDPEFSSWAQQIFPKIQNSQKALMEVCHMYSLGSKQRREGLSEGFWNETQVLHNILQRQEAMTEGTKSRQIKKENDISQPTSRDMLLTLQYPTKGRLRGLNDFFAKHMHEANTVSVYMMYSLMQQSPHVQELYDQIEADPAFGQELIYSREPLFRVDSNATGQERPDWTTLTTFNKLKAILMIEKLIDDPQLAEMIAYNIQKDVEMGHSEIGGIFDFRIDEKTDTVNLVPEVLKSESITDGAFSSRDPCNLFSLFGFHQHSLTFDNHEASGPSGSFLSGDLGGASTRQMSAFVITSTGREIREGVAYQRFNIDLYGYNNAPGNSQFVLDLGQYEAPVIENYVMHDAHQIEDK